MDIENSQISIGIKFDPIFDIESKGTNAQLAALQFVEFLKMQNEELEEDDK